MRLSERVKRLEVACAPGDLPPIFALTTTREDGVEVTAGGMGSAQVPDGLTIPEFEFWAAEHGLKPFAVSFCEPKRRGWQPVGGRE